MTMLLHSLTTTATHQSVLSSSSMNTSIQLMRLVISITSGLLQSLGKLLDS